MSPSDKAQLPPQHRSSALWQSEPDERLKDYQSGPLPSAADVVVVGSGLTGALIAHNLVTGDRASRPKCLVMLEAISLSSGATGRNGGHIKPDIYRDFDTVAAKFGTSVAVQQCSFEAANHLETVDFIKKQGLAEEAQLVEYRSADVFLTQRSWDAAVSCYNNLKAAGGDVSTIDVLDPTRAKTELRVNQCVGAITFPASSLWPYRLAVALNGRSVDHGMELHTNTPATGVTETSEGGWLIATPRGNIKTQKVIFATNAYTSILVPEAVDRILPVKGVVVAVPPPPSYEREPLTTSFAFHADEDFDYLIQRPEGGKQFILGGASSMHPEGYAGTIGDCDDGEVPEEIVNALRGRLSRYLQDWGLNARPDFAWSGVMGFTTDTFPFIGAVPGKPGQYLAAGFQGHGMARIFLCANSFCQFFRGEPVDSRVPSHYFDVANRLLKPVAKEELVGLLRPKSKNMPKRPLRAKLA